MDRSAFLCFFGFASIGLSACTEPIVEEISVLSALEDNEPVAVEFVSGMGTGTVEAAVRLVNSHGASVPGGMVALSVDGENVTYADTQVDIDAFGYATIEVRTSKPEIVNFAITESEDLEDLTDMEVTGTVTIVEDELPDFANPWITGFGLYDEEPSFAAHGNGGMAIAAANAVWWQPTEQGRPGHRVLELDDTVDGLWSAHIDNDGIADLVLWSSAKVIAMRGRPGGGYGWGAAWKPSGGGVMGAAAVDVNLDRVTDIAIGITNGDTGSFVVLQGDGVWGFEAGLALELEYGVGSLTASDEDSDGQPEVTVLSSTTGSLRRYTLAEEGWIGANPPELSAYNASSGAYLLPITDINMGGAPEIIVVGSGDESSQDLAFYVISKNVTLYPQAFGDFYPSLWDMDQNGSTDILAFEDDVLHIVRYDVERGGFVSQNISGFGDLGPIAAYNVDSDDVADVVVASDVVTVHPGEIDQEDGSWAGQAISWTRYTTNLTGPGIVYDMDDNGLSDLVGFATSDTELVVGAWFLSQDSTGDNSLVLGGKESLGDGYWGLDIVRCGESIYTLAQSSTWTELSRLEVDYPEGDDMMEPILMSGPEVVSGSLLACGTLSDGEEGVVVATTSGAYVTYDTELSTVDSSSVGVTGDVALADTDGDGGGEVVGCDESECQVLAVDLDNDGDDELLYGGPSLGFDWDGTGEITALPGSGNISVADVDSDGRLDLLVANEETGRLMIFRAVENGLVNPVGFATDRELDGPLFLGEVSGDDSAEFVLLDIDGRLLHASATGGGGPSSDGDTGDTGSSESSDTSQ